MVLKLIKLMSLAKLLRPERQIATSLSKASRNTILVESLNSLAPKARSLLRTDKSVLSIDSAFVLESCNREIANLLVGFRLSYTRSSTFSPGLRSSETEPIRLTTPATTAKDNISVACVSTFTCMASWTCVVAFKGRPGCRERDVKLSSSPHAILWSADPGFEKWSQSFMHWPYLQTRSNQLR